MLMMKTVRVMVRKRRKERKQRSTRHGGREGMGRTKGFSGFEKINFQQKTNRLATVPSCLKARHSALRRAKSVWKSLNQKRKTYRHGDANTA
ncbi:hypothetical protein PoB_001134700 [Plakobranchus ocellatus]|uniref:Uncharacterized protein n=1 Tax=Plakobranchus ocellatus TaxID=259542 RepID=A0AAV3YPE8_9GAST|nr:hypothetical protein PoB_001134700 [Plakobranchus ocellatus]